MLQEKRDEYPRGLIVEYQHHFHRNSLERCLGLSLRAFDYPESH
jgi:hypothetical protein